MRGEGRKKIPSLFLLQDMQANNMLVMEEN